MKREAITLVQAIWCEYLLNITMKTNIGNIWNLLHTSGMRACDAKSRLSFSEVQPAIRAVCQYVMEFLQPVSLFAKII